ncbi:MAG: leucine-rich repeat protein [Lachnospiraceae bacterium]|nr:leucine-rich repeat protein [Lachnospiraceae bacterium]
MIEWIVSSSVLILIIIAIRFLLKGKISLRLQYALWALVLIRLLIPFNIGSTSISVLNFTDELVADHEVWQDVDQNTLVSDTDDKVSDATLVDADKLEADNSGNNVVSDADDKSAYSTGNNQQTNVSMNGSQTGEVTNNFGSASASSRYNEYIDKTEPDRVTTGTNTPTVSTDIQKENINNNSSEASAGVVNAGNQINAENMENTDNKINTEAGISESRNVAELLLKIAIIAWIAGMVFVGGYFAVSNILFRLELKKDRELLKDVENCNLPIYLTESIDTPCMLGLIRSKIYVTPEATKSEKVFRHVLEHEKTHYYHKDQIWCVLRTMALIVHWYNPLVWLAALLSRSDSELACDEGTISRIGEVERAEYGRTLIGLTCQKKNGLFVAATTMTGSKKSIKERIMLIAKKPKMALYTFIAVMMIVVAAVGCTFTGADDKPTIPSVSDNTSGEKESTPSVEEPTTPSGEEPTTPGGEKETTPIGETPTSSTEDTTKDTTNDETTSATETETTTSEPVIDGIACRVEGDTLIISGNGTVEQTDIRAIKEEFKHVIIEEGVVAIGDSAFNGCDTMESIELPQSLIAMDAAFMYCTALKEIAIPNGVRGVLSGFEGCTSLEKVVLSSGITDIGEWCFAGCTNLKEIVFSARPVVFGAYAFEGVPWLEEQRKENPLVIINGVLVDAATATGEIVVPEGVTTIGDFAIGGGVTAVILPKSLEYVSWRAFYGCENLEKVTFLGGTEYTIEYDAFGGCSNLKEITFGEGLKEIGYEAFFGCSSLQKIALPEGTTTIGDRAFEFCINLKEVDIPESLVNIGGHAFIETAWLNDRRVENPLVVVNGVLIDGVMADSDKVEVPEGVIRIASFAFGDMSYYYGEDFKIAIKEIVLPDGLEYIDEWAFQGCYDMTKITIPDTVEYGNIAVDAFSNVDNLTIYGESGSTAQHYANDMGAKFEELVTYNYRFDGDKLVFYGTGTIDSDQYVVDGKWIGSDFRHIIIEEGITEIDFFAFNDCEKLESIVIPSTVEVVAGFSGCSNLKEVTLAEGVKRIEECAFEGCNSLEKIVIPESMESIMLWAFLGCTSLEEVVLPEGFEGYDKDSFLGTAWLENMKADSPFAIYEGALIDYNPELAVGDIVIPEGVTDIMSGAFAYATEITSVTFPKSIEYIGYEAFVAATNIEEIIFLDNVATIDSGAFVGCNGLTEVVLPEGLTSIGSEAFVGCSNLRRVVLPESLEYMGYRAFEGCAALEEIVIPENFTGFSGLPFISTAWQEANRSEDGLVIVNGVLLDARKALGSIEVPTGVARIDRWGFEFAEKLLHVEIPEGVTAIDDFAFSCAYSITSVTIPASVESIAEYAFYDCDNLKAIYGIKGSYAEAYAETIGVEFVDIEEYTERTEISGKVDELYAVGNALDMTLYAKDGTEYNTYIIEEDSVAECIAAWINRYEYNMVTDKPTALTDEYYIKLSAVAENNNEQAAKPYLAIHQSAAGYIEYYDGEKSIYWVATAVNERWDSIAEDVHRMYDVFDVHAVDRGSFETTESDAMKVVEYFVNEIYKEAWLGLALGNIYGISNYEMCDYGYTAENDVIHGWFEYNYTRNYPDSEYVLAQNTRMSGDLQSIYATKMFEFSKQADGTWDYIVYID